MRCWHPGHLHASDGKRFSVSVSRPGGCAHDLRCRIPHWHLPVDCAWRPCALEPPFALCSAREGFRPRADGCLRNPGLPCSLGPHLRHSRCWELQTGQEEGAESGRGARGRSPGPRTRYVVMRWFLGLASRSLSEDHMKRYRGMPCWDQPGCAQIPLTGTLLPAQGSVHGVTCPGRWDWYGIDLGLSFSPSPCYCSGCPRTSCSSCLGKARIAQ